MIAALCDVPGKMTASKGFSSRSTRTLWLVGARSAKRLIVIGECPAPMARKSEPRSVGRRLSGDQRREEILAAAADVIDAQGFLPAPVEQIARAAGVSKALVYAYFPTQAALCNALLMRAMAPLAQRIAKLRGKAIEALAAGCADIYFDDTAKHGVLTHILLTDHFLDGQRDSEALKLRNAIWRRLARAARGYGGLDPRARIAALAIILAIPEEIGRLAHRGELKPDRARELCARLVLSSLRGVRGVAMKAQDA
jgi:AcrR family transcriptional regulator